MCPALRRNYCHNSGQGAGQGMRRAIASPTWPCAWPSATDAASDMGTPLQWAVMFMRIDIVHMLVAKCACACAATCLPSGAFQGLPSPPAATWLAALST